MNLKLKYQIECFAKFHLLEICLYQCGQWKLHQICETWQDFCHKDGGGEQYDDEDDEVWPPTSPTTEKLNAPGPQGGVHGQNVGRKFGVDDPGLPTSWKTTLGRATFSPNLNTFTKLTMKTMKTRTAYN